MLYQSFLALFLSGASLVAGNLEAEPLFAEPSTLFFSANELTKGERPVQQLTCSGGSGSAYYRLANLTCTSIAPITDFSGSELHWKCTANVPDEFVLGGTTVSCEEYDPLDPNKIIRHEPEEVPDAPVLGKRIVEGSCAASYSIHLSDLGEQLESTLQQIYDSDDQSAAMLDDIEKSGGGVYRYFFWTLFSGSAAFMIYNFFFRQADNVAGPRHRLGRGGGAGGGSNDDDNQFPGNDNDNAGSSTWNPINQYSTLNRGAATRETLRTPIITRSQSSTTGAAVAPPLVQEGPRFSSTREVTTFGGTEKR